MKDLYRGVLAQLRVIHALALRETKTRFGQHRAGYLWALLEPLFWIGTFWGLYTLVGRDSMAGMPFVPFLATGIVTYLLFSATLEKVAQAISANKALLFYPQVHTLDLVFARAVLELATYVVLFAIIMGGYGLLLQSIEFENLLRVLWGLILAAMVGMTAGLVVCGLTVLSATVERVRGPLMRPMFWISGLFFTAESLPTDVREAMLWNPVLHCVEIVRDGWFPSYHGVHASSAYVLYWIVGLAFVGLTLERAVRRRIQVT